MSCWVAELTFFVAWKLSRIVFPAAWAAATAHIRALLCSLTATQPLQRPLQMVLPGLQVCQPLLVLLKHFRAGIGHKRRVVQFLFDFRNLVCRLLLEKKKAGLFCGGIDQTF